VPPGSGSLQYWNDESDPMAWARVGLGEITFRSRELIKILNLNSTLLTQRGKMGEISPVTGMTCNRPQSFMLIR